MRQLVFLVVAITATVSGCVQEHGQTYQAGSPAGMMPEANERSTPLVQRATDRKVWQLKPGQGGWVGEDCAVPTSHGVVPDAAATVYNRPVGRRKVRVVRHAAGVLHVYLGESLGRRPYQEPPFMRELSVRIHWEREE